MRSLAADQRLQLLVQRIAKRLDRALQTSGRRLILRTLACAIAAALGTALAPTPSLLLAATFVLGASCAAIQMTVPLVASMVPPAWTHGGWTWVCAVAGLFGLLGLITDLATRTGTS